MNSRRSQYTCQMNFSATFFGFIVETKWNILKMEPFNFLRNFQIENWAKANFQLSTINDLRTNWGERCIDQYSKLFNNCLTLFVYILSFIAVFFFFLHQPFPSPSIVTLARYTSITYFQTNYLLLFYPCALYSESECIFHSIYIHIWSVRMRKKRDISIGTLAEIFSLRIRIIRAKKKTL